MALARRFIINEKGEKAFGVGSISGIIRHNLLDAFSVVNTQNEDEIIMFPKLTENELALMSKADYERRLRAFLASIGITDPTEVEQFVNSSVVEI